MSICGKSSSVRYIAAIDLGASNGRIVLGCFRGRRLAMQTVHRFEHQARQRGGYLRWDWSGIENAILLGLNRAARAIHPATLDSVSCCGWAQDFGLLDGRGHLIFEPVSYRDARAKAGFAAVTARIAPADLVRRVGSLAHSMTTLARLRSMVDQEPGMMKKAASLLFIADLVHYRLCGLVATDTTLATASQLVNLKTGKWDRALLKLLGIPCRLLPRLCAKPAVLGPVNASALPPALTKTKVVVSAGHDTAAAVSVVPSDDDAAFLSSGTWSMLGCRQQHAHIPLALIRSNWGLLGLSGGTWSLLKGIAGLWLIQECRRAWARAGSILSFEDIMLSARAHLPVKSLIDPEALAFQSPADMPAAIRAACRQTGQPVPVAKGQIAAVVFTSLALDYRWALEELELATGRSFKTFWIMGGGNRNQLLNQLAADALGLPVLAGPSEATALGNLLLQAQLKGIIGDDQQRERVVAATCPPRRYRPQSDWAGRLYPQFVALKQGRGKYM